MKSKSLILMGIAMACGLVAAYTTAKLTAGPKDTKLTIPVAISEVKIGTVLREPEKLFVMHEVSEELARGRMDSIEKMKDKIVTRTIRPTESVFVEDLSSNFGITPPKGHRAMAIKVTPDAAVGGFIMPGSRVDVLATLTEIQNRPEVITVLQNQEVLAVDKISLRPDGQSAVDTVNNVTLAVTPGNAQKLELALKKSGGVVRLLLRDQSDNSNIRITSSKTLSDAAVDFGAAANGEGGVVRVLAAKGDIKPGTLIDDPSKYFETMQAAALPERGYTDQDLDKLHGQIVQVPLFKGSFATAKHFETVTPEGKTTAAVEPAKLKRTVMFIQNGGKEPQVVTFSNGVADSTTPPAGNDKPAKPMDGAHEKHS